MSPEEASFEKARITAELIVNSTKTYKSKNKTKVIETLTNIGMKLAGSVKMCFAVSNTIKRAISSIKYITVK